MAEWGRKQYSQAWPSRAHVWTWGAFFLSCLFVVFAVWLDGQRNWTAAERLYLMDYLRSGTRGKASASFSSRYTLLEGINAKGQEQLLLNNQVEAFKGEDGRLAYRLTDEGLQAGLVRLQWTAGMYNDRRLHGFLGQWVYQNQTLWDFAKRPTEWTVAFLVLLLFGAVPRDRARRMVWKHGRRLRGPELVTTAEFNEKLGRSKWLMTYFPDGISLINGNPGTDGMFPDPIHFFTSSLSSCHCELRTVNSELTDGSSPSPASRGTAGDTLPRARTSARAQPA